MNVLRKLFERALRVEGGKVLVAGEEKRRPNIAAMRQGNGR